MKIRLLRRLNGTSIPKLVVAKRVLTRMVAAAQRHIEDETGEALVGLIVPGDDDGMPTFYVLDTISPDDTALRLYHTFQQGDERQDELIWWLQENWLKTRPNLTGEMKKFDAPLRYLGDWHKQPGYMIQPSDGDLFTALDWIDDDSNGMDFLLAPIVTLGHPHTVVPTGGNFLMTPQGENTALRADFWYIDEDSRAFLPITPVECPNEQLPPLAPYPWHLLDEARFTSELRRLEDEGYFVSVTLWDADSIPPLEICLLTTRVGLEHLLIIVTPYDFPSKPPVVRVAPLIHMGDGDDMYDVFAQAWEQSKPATDVVDWKPEEGLISMLRAVESQLMSASTSPTVPPTGHPPKEEIAP